MRNSSLVLAAAIAVASTFAIYVFATRQDADQHPPVKLAENPAISPSLLAFPGASSGGAREQGESRHAQVGGENSSSFANLSLRDAPSPTTPPAHPVWELLADYKKKAHPTKGDQAELVSAISYCLNMDGSVQALATVQGQGKAAPGEIQGLQSNIGNLAKYCARLLPADYRVRSDIAREEAKHGDVNAMEAFLEMGPQGVWPSSARLANRTPDELKAWEIEAVGYVKQAAGLGRRSALQTLAMVYSTAPSSSGAEEPTAFSSFYDPATAYLYAYAWVGNVESTASPSTRKSLQLYLARYEKGVDAQQKAEAQKQAQKFIN